MRNKVKNIQWTGVILVIVTCACSSNISGDPVPDVEHGFLLIRGTAAILPSGAPILQEVLAGDRSALPAPLDGHALPENAIYIAIDASLESRAGSPAKESKLDGRPEFFYEFIPIGATDSKPPSAPLLIRNAELMCKRSGASSQSGYSCEEITIATPDGASRWLFSSRREQGPQAVESEEGLHRYHGQLATYWRSWGWKGFEPCFQERIAAE